MNVVKRGVAKDVTVWDFVCDHTRPTLVGFDDDGTPRMEDLPDCAFISSGHPLKKWAEARGRQHKAEHEGATDPDVVAKREELDDTHRAENPETITPGRFDDTGDPLRPAPEVEAELDDLLKGVRMPEMVVFMQQMEDQ